MKKHRRKHLAKTLQDRIDSSNEGLNVSLLPPGTILTLETLYSFYRVEIVEGKEILITGGMRKDGEDRFPNPTKAIICGSTWGGSCIKVDWIGREMHLEVVFGEDLKNKLLTSRILNLTIEAPDGSWSYSMDWK